MKRLMIIGGILGFLIGLGMGSGATGADAATILWRSSIACFAGGILLRWWGSVWVRCLRETREMALASNQSPESGVDTNNQRGKSNGSMV